MKIKCPSCGFENEKEARFCEKCKEPLPNPYIKKKKNEGQSFKSTSGEEAETKNRIEKEERIRAEAKVKAEKEIKEKEQKKQGMGCLIFLGVIVIIAFIIFSGGDGENEKETKPSSIDLTASVSFTGTQFVIINLDTFDWTNVRLEVNSGLLKSGYVLKTQRMSSEETYTVGAMQFAKGDGTRLNPFTTKPQNFSIWCDTPRGKGFWYSEWRE